MKDFEGNKIIVGDSVAVLNTLDDNSLENTLSSLEFGVVVAIEKNNVKVKIGKEEKTFNNLKISKISENETADDFIIRLANNLETLQLMQESDILNSMLQ